MLGGRLSCKAVARFRAAVTSVSKFAEALASRCVDRHQARNPPSLPNSSNKPETGQSHTKDAVSIPCRDLKTTINGSMVLLFASEDAPHFVSPPPSLPLLPFAVAAVAAFVVQHEPV